MSQVYEDPANEGDAYRGAAPALLGKRYIDGSGRVFTIPTALLVDASGAPYSATGGGGGGGSTTVNTKPTSAVLYDTNASGTGYNAGDVLISVFAITDGSPSTVVRYWLNATQGTVLSANPTPSTLVEQGNLGTPITGQALATGGAGNIGWLSTVNKTNSDGFGAAGDTPPTIANNARGVIGYLRSILDANGAAGASPPTLAGSGVIGYLRGLFDLTGAAGDTPPTLATNAKGLIGYLRGLFDLTGTLGTTSPPTLTGGSTGLLGMLRIIYEKLTASIAVTGTVTVSGNLGGKTGSVATTSPVQAAAYTAGNVIGNNGSGTAAQNGILTFTNLFGSAGSGELRSASLSFKSNLSAHSFALYLFRAMPTASTFTDKTAPAIADADKDKLITVINFTSGATGMGTHTFFPSDAIGSLMSIGGTTAYGVLITTTAPTFASTTDLVAVRLTVAQD